MAGICCEKSQRLLCQLTYRLLKVLPSLFGPDQVAPAGDATTGWLLSALGDTELARSISGPLCMKESG